MGLPARAQGGGEVDFREVRCARHPQSQALRQPPVHDMGRGMGEKRGFVAEPAGGGVAATLAVAGTDWLAGYEQFIASGAEPAVLHTRTIAQTRKLAGIRRRSASMLLCAAEYGRRRPANAGNVFWWAIVVGAVFIGRGAGLGCDHGHYG